MNKLNNSESEEGIRLLYDKIMLTGKRQYTTYVQLAIYDEPVINSSSKNITGIYNSNNDDDDNNNKNQKTYRKIYTPSPGIPKVEPM